MRRAALSIAVLLGITAPAIDARAAQALSATMVLERSTVLVADGRPHRHGGFHHRSAPRQWGPAKHRHQDVHHGFAPRRWGPAKHRFQPDRDRRPAFVSRRIQRAPVMIFKPIHRRSFGHRHLVPRPLIRNGSFAWRHYRW